jgi:hypothetical protein
MSRPAPRLRFAAALALCLSLALLLGGTTSAPATAAVSPLDSPWPAPANGTFVGNFSFQVEHTTIVVGELLRMLATISEPGNPEVGSSLDIFYGDGSAATFRNAFFLPNGTELVPSAHTYGAPGSYSVIAQGYDPHGNLSAPVFRNITVGPAPTSPALPTQQAAVLLGSAVTGTAVGIAIWKRPPRIVGPARPPPSRPPESAP